MLFFARCVVAIVGFLPKEWKFTTFFRWLFNYISCREKIIAWHRVQIEKHSVELEKFDTNFCLQRAGIRLNIAREKAEKEGMDPRDPNYPRIFDFISLPKINAIKILGEK